MSVGRYIMHQKLSDGSYEDVYCKSESGLIYRPNGRTVEQDLAAYLPEYQNSDTVPESLKPGKLVVYNDRVYIGDASGNAMEVITLAHELNIGSIGNIELFSGKTTDQIVDYLIEKMVDNKIGNVGKYDGLITGEIALGNYVDMAGYTWRVCHIDEEAQEFYLIMNTIHETTQFGSNNTYAGSTIAQKCASFLNDLPAEVMNILLMKTVSGVTSKVFIPSYDQVKGGFDLFNSNANRIAYNESGAAAIWWASTAYSSSGVWFVNSGGSLSNYDPSNANGFRPCVALKL